MEACFICLCCGYPPARGASIADNVQFYGPSTDHIAALQTTQGCRYPWKRRTRLARSRPMTRTMTPVPGQADADGGIMSPVPQRILVGDPHGLGRAPPRTWSFGFAAGGQASQCSRAPCFSASHHFPASSRYPSRPGCHRRRTSRQSGCQLVASPSDLEGVLRRLRPSWNGSSAMFPVRNFCGAC